eukprot:SAG31_NODE_7176_length_1764_cov_1.500600_2_plen_65_part_00
MRQGYEPYADPSAVESQFYFPTLGLSKTLTMHDPTDVLGQTILSKNFSYVTWCVVSDSASVRNS